MLEILLIIQFTKKIGAIVEAKGLKSGGYKAMLVGFWIGGEILGMIIGSAFDLGLGAYGLALACAAGGAFSAFAIAKNAKPALSAAPDAEVAAVFE